MADRTIEVVTPATNFDFLTIDEAKVLLGMSQTDTSQDALLALWITTFSTTIAEYCNRTFAREKVVETWRETDNGRLFLSHWPVKHIDVEVVTNGTDLTVLDESEYELEVASGKLSLITNPGGPKSTPWEWPAVVTYTGGYVLPDETPPPLKHAVVLLIRDERIRMQQAQVAGIRSISHKESRVMFFDPNAILIKSAGMKSGVMQQIDPLIRQYMRFEV